MNPVLSHLHHRGCYLEAANGAAVKNAGIVSAVVLGIFALVAGVCALNGVMLSYLWQWFIVPLGVRPIGLSWAIGIAIIASMLTYQGAGKSDGDGSEALNKLLMQPVGKVVAFGIAYCLSFGVSA